MDEDNNQENRTTDLQESMQKGKSLLNSAKDKGKKISGSKTLHNKSGGNVVEKGAKVRANIERAKGHAKKTKGAAKVGVGAGTIAAGGATTGAGTALTALGGALASTVIGAPAAAPLIEAGQSAIKTGADITKKGANTIKSGTKDIAAGTKDLKRAKEIEKTGKSKGKSDDSSSPIPKPIKPKIPDKMQLYRKAKEKIVRTTIKIAIIIGAILLFLLILMIITIFSRSSQKTNGSYNEGDLSNVPYVVDSQIMSKLIITTDESGKFKFAFQDDEGNEKTLDEAIDAALETLAANGCKAYNDMGDTDEDRKKILKKMILAEIATQYPDLSNEMKKYTEEDNSDKNTTVNNTTVDSNNTTDNTTSENSNSTANNTTNNTKTDNNANSTENNNSENSESNSNVEVASDIETGWIWTMSFENMNAYLYHHNSDRVSYEDSLYVKGYITEDRKNYIVVANPTGLYLGPGVQLESNAPLFQEFGVDVSGLSAGAEVDADIVENVSKKAYENMVEKVKSDALEYGVTLSDTQAMAGADAYYLNGPYSSATNLGNLYNQYGDTESLARNYIGFSYVESEEQANSRSSCAWVLFHFGKFRSVSNDFNEMLESGEISNFSTYVPSGGSSSELQGRIQIKRKDENGNEKILKYTDPVTFNSLISKKNSSVMNYYTLESGSGNTATDVNGVKLEGGDVAEQIWNFFINDMGYSEPVAAGIMGNIMRECGGDTLSGLDPSAQNSYGNGHYGIIQWDMVYCSEVVGQDLAGQLAFFSRWIQSNEFDTYAGNYQAGFSYEKFLQLTDPEQAAIAFGSIMERFGTPYSSGGMNSEYERRGSNAKNAYATLAGTSTNKDKESENKDSSKSDKTSKDKDSSKSDKKSKDKDSSKSNKTSNSSSSSTSSSGNSFLQTAIECHKYLRENGYRYSQGRAIPIVKGEPENERRVDCSAYVSWCLYEFGLYKEKWELSAESVKEWGKQGNLETIYEGSTNNVKDIPDIQPGDIVVQVNPNHTQIFYGYDDSGTAIWLNCGQNDPINNVEGEEKYNKVSQPIVYVGRVKNGGSSSSPIVTSLDNFLFIGDSRYTTSANQIEALGNNINNQGVGSARIDEWLKVASNGGKGTVQSKSVDITGTYSGISVQLGANSINATVDAPAGAETAAEQMKEFLDKLKELHPGTPIFVNSCLGVNSNATSSGYSWDVSKMRDNMKAFDQVVSDYCNQTEDLYFIDISSDLMDENGFVKLEYESDGLHCNTEGSEIFAKNIKEAILAMGASSNNSSSSNGACKYKLVVASKNETSTTIKDTYTYSNTYSIEKSNGIQKNGLKQQYSEPGDKTVSSASNSTYTKTAVDYQTALQKYTLYFDFLWAILINTSGDSELISNWADLALNGSVIITVYSDSSSSSSTTTVDKGTYSHTEASDGPVAIYDVYNVSEQTIKTTKSINSKPAITKADTWLIDYTNQADSYSEFKGKTKEKLIEKIDEESESDNIIKILRNDRRRMIQLYREEDTVDLILEENEKVNFMIDVYSYILQVARGELPDKVKLKINSLLDTSVFDLSNTDEASVNKVLLYDSLDLSEADIEMLYNAVEKICEPFGDNDENTNRKKMVTSVILNRVMSSKFPDSVKAVLKQRHQFENLNSISELDNITVSDSTKQAVDTVIVGGDCAQRSVYFAKPSTAEKNKWDDKYKFTFNDGDKTDNSFNYYTTDEVDSELEKYETTISGNTTRPSLTAQKIIKWAKSQVGKSKFENRHENTTMSSNNSSPQFVKSAYFEGGMEYLSGDIPCPNEIKRKDDGTIDWSDIPEAAVIVSNSGIVSLYIGNGYVIEAGGDTIKKLTIDESQSGKDAKGWGFAASDQDSAKDELVVAIGGGNYAEGWTSFGYRNEQIRATGIAGVYRIGNRTHNVYVQGWNDLWGPKPFSEGNYGSSACGATSVAIIVSGYKGDVRPDEIGACMYSHTNYVTSHDSLSYALNQYGLKAEWKYTISKDEIIQHLKEGNPVILNIYAASDVIVGRSAYDGHYVTLLGINSKGEIMLGDPAGGGINNGYFSEDEIFGNLGGTNSSVCFISQ